VDSALICNGKPIGITLYTSLTTVFLEAEEVADVFIKNIDEKAYRLAKILAAEEDKRVGEVVAQSILLYARQNEKKGLKAIKPVSLGKGTEKLSGRIDEILYGD
jgi:hypothetical protein